MRTPRLSPTLEHIPTICPRPQPSHPHPWRLLEDLCRSASPLLRSLRLPIPLDTTSRRLLWARTVHSLQERLLPTTLVSTLSLALMPTSLEPSPERTGAHPLPLSRASAPPCLNSSSPSTLIPSLRLFEGRQTRSEARPASVWARHTLALVHRCPRGPRAQSPRGRARQDGILTAAT